MKKQLLLILILCGTTSLWAQNKNLDYKMALKVYNLTTYEDVFNSEKLQDSSGLRYNFSNSTLMILHPTIAFQWRTKNHNFHEAELTNLMLRKMNTETEAVQDSTGSSEIIGGTQITNTFVSIRYEYIMNFSKKKDSKFVPSIGFGANPYLQREKNLPKVANAYRTAETTVGLRTYLTPRITWHFSPKLFIDLNIPICVFDSYFDSNKVGNPAFSTEQQKIYSFNIESKNNFSGRLGIGLKI